MMTFKILADDGDKDHDGYTVKTQCNCRLIFGSVPMGDLAMLTRDFSKHAILDIDLADRVGATFVLGEPADLQRLRQAELPISPKRQRQAQQARQAGQTVLAQWLLDGERGASADALAKAIFGFPVEASTAHPHDVADLQRCLSMLIATHSEDRVQAARGLSAQWDALLAHWDELIDLFTQETQGSPIAPNTNAWMRRLLSESPAPSPQ